MLCKTGQAETCKFLGRTTRPNVCHVPRTLWQMIIAKGVSFHGFVLGIGCTSRVPWVSSDHQEGLFEHWERLCEVWLRVVESRPACGSGTVLPASISRQGISTASSISVCRCKERMFFRMTETCNSSWAIGRSLNVPSIWWGISTHFLKWLTGYPEIEIPWLIISFPIQMALKVEYWRWSDGIRWSHRLLARSNGGQGWEWGVRKAFSDELQLGCDPEFSLKMHP